MRTAQLLAWIFSRLTVFSRSERRSKIQPSAKVFDRKSSAPRTVKPPTAIIRDPRMAYEVLEPASWGAASLSSMIESSVFAREMPKFLSL